MIFAKTPAREEIVDRYKRMMALNADPPKIAVMPQNERDVMVMLAAMNESLQVLAGRSSAFPWASSAR